MKFIIEDKDKKYLERIKGGELSPPIFKKGDTLNLELEIDNPDIFNLFLIHIISPQKQEINESLGFTLKGFLKKDKEQ